MNHARRAVLPLAVLVATLGVHYVWVGLFPERDPVQDRWAAVPAQGGEPWWGLYVASQSHWLGLSYGLSLGFAAAALRRYRERRSCTARNVAAGGVTLSGLLAVGACYMAGCCGSPMLVVYLNLFGAKFLPFAKPMVAALTATSLLIAWSWMVRQPTQAAGPTSCCPVNGEAC